MYQSESLNEIHDLDQKIEIICSDKTLGGTIVEVGGALSVGELFHRFSSSKNSFLRMTPTCDLKFCDSNCKMQDCADLTSEQCIRKIFAIESKLSETLPCDHYFIYAQNIQYDTHKNSIRGWAGVSYARSRTNSPQVFVIHVEFPVKGQDDKLKSLATFGTNLIYAAIYQGTDEQLFTNSLRNGFSQDTLNIKEVFMSNNQTVDGLLKRAIAQEVESQQFYKKALEKARDNNVKNFLKELIREEEQHERMMKNVMENDLYDGDAAVDAALLKNIKHSHETENFKWSAKVSMKEILKAALTREFNAIKLFEGYAALPLHPEVQSLFKNLALEEKRHHQEIDKKFQALTGDMGDDF